MSRSYEYRHLVCLEETNLLGNTYFVNHFKWQGRCREIFLSEHAPGVIALLERDLRLVTTHCSCDYYGEVLPFDEVVVTMRLLRVEQNRLRLGFDYAAVRDGERVPLARGEQEVACMRLADGGLEPVAVPEELHRALVEYGA